jgi:hypothetical protein
MAVHSHAQAPYKRQSALPRWRIRIHLPAIDWRPRRCMVVSVSMVFLGIGVPLLMILEFLPLVMPLFLLGFLLAASGGVCALIFCGEI